MHQYGTAAAAHQQRSLTPLEFLSFLHPNPPQGDADACVVSFWKRSRPGGPVNVELGGIRTDQLGEHWPRIEPYLRGDLYYTPNALGWFPETRIKPNPETLLTPWKRDCRTVRWLVAFFVDLDWHEGPAPSRIERLNILETKRVAAGMPPASAAVFTPRGLQVLWRIEPVRCHHYAQRKWQTAQSVLIEKLGADAKCKEAHRLFRLPGCVNPETGIMAECEVMDASVHHFDEICGLLHVHIVEKAAQAVGEKDRRRQIGGRSRYQVLADGILQIIEKVWHGRIPVGKRHNVVWMLATMLRRAGHSAELIEENCLRVGRAASLRDNEILRRVRAVTGPLKQSYPHRSYDRLCRELGITSEQRKLITAWFGPRVRLRTILRAKQKEKREGEYRQLQMKARILQQQGLSIRKIAAALGVPSTGVFRMLEKPANRDRHLSGFSTFGAPEGFTITPGFCSTGPLFQNWACWTKPKAIHAPANPILEHSSTRKLTKTQGGSDETRTA